jgi:putative restriction endonuclease
MEGWIAVTHSEWFDFLVKRGIWEEVNFWTPSDYYSFRGTPGAPFLFKLKAPHNAIGGVGFFERFVKLPEWLAWECFGEANGASSFQTMKARLDALRAKDKLRGGSGLTQIGCIILSSAVFFPSSEWIPQPTDWARQNLRYTRYDLTVGEGRRVWDACLQRLSAREQAATPLLVARETAPRYGAPVLVAPRLGQGGFRVAVTEAYHRCCAVTHEHSLPVLEAAHIRAYADDGPHDVRNGILLRSDLHRLLDKGYVTVSPTFHLEVSARLRTDYENGHSYYPLHGTEVAVPREVALCPGAEFLSWHNERVYLG